MSKLTLSDVGSLVDTTTAQTTINNNWAAIETAMENTLSRDGTSPNTMSTSLDMNSQQILNLPQPMTASSALRYADLNSFVGGGTVTNIPAGGNIHNVLQKNSNTSYDVSWQPVSASMTAGANISLSGVDTVSVATVQNPNFTTSVTTPSLALNGTTVNSFTGTGSIVLATNPVLGAFTATSMNKVAVTAPASNATLTIPDGVTFTGPATSGTAMTLGNTETVTGVKTFGSAGAVGRLKIAGTTSGSTILDATAVASGTLTLPAATDTLVGKATTDTLTNKTIDASQLVANTVSNAKLSQMAGNTIKGNNTGSTANASDLSVAQTQTLLAQGFVAIKGVVDFNVGATDTAISFTLPTGFTRWRWGFATISGASASISTATFGVFTATGGGGTALVAAGTAITVTASAEDTNNNMMLVTPANQNTQSHNQTTIYFRVGTPQGSAATGTFTIFIQPVS